MEGELNMNFKLECQKFIQDDATLEWKTVPMTIDFNHVCKLQPDVWDNDIPVFRMEYMVEDGKSLFERVSYILTNFKVIQK